LAELRVGEQTGMIAERLDHYVGFILEKVTNRRMAANVASAVALFLLGILLTLFVLIKGLGAWIPLYERALS